MRSIVQFAAVALLVGVATPGMPQIPASGTQQTPPTAAVPIPSEPHHHMVFDSPEARAFYIYLPAKERTLIHQHDADYVWVGLGGADIVNATVNKPQVHLHSKDGALHFARAPFAHAAINEGTTVYRNVTVALLQKQDNPLNLCDEVLEGKPTDCVPATPGEFSEGKGITVRPQFETDELRFDQLTLDPSQEVVLRASTPPPLVVALHGTDAKAFPGTEAPEEHLRHLKGGDVMSGMPGLPLTLRNTGAEKARFLVFEFKPSK